MRVNQTGSQSSSAATSTTSSQSKKIDSAKENKSESRVSRAAQDSARAEISDRARDLAKAQALASSAPEVREDRVAELKKRISEGTYELDAQAIADRMVEDHLRAPIG